MNHDKLGYHNEFSGIDFLFNPELFVDTNLQICKSADGKVWTHINSNVSKEVYHVYQDYTSESQSYSFLGLYRKYSEADLFVMMDLYKKEEVES